MESEKELEEELKDLGSKLLKPQPSIDVLLNLLDKVESSLAKVEQVPSRSMEDALLPVMTALISDELLRHTDMDVKVSVASCITEITRITAPDAPYNDEQMKEIFQLTITALGNLSHVSTRCYYKAVTILDTVAKVRSCLMMLDLECDALVIEMFQHFLRNIKSNHPCAVFSAMEAIMTLVLEESEDVSLELLTPILDCVRKGNEYASPISWKLGEKVLRNCATKLKNSLAEAVQTMRTSLDDYAPIVASICQSASGVLSVDNMKSPGEYLGVKISEEAHLDAPSKVADDAVLDASDRAVDLPTDGLSNDDTLAKNPFQILLDHLCSIKDLKRDDLTGIGYRDFDLGFLRAVRSELEIEMGGKKRGRRPNSLMNPEEGYDHSWFKKERKASELASSKKHMSKKSASKHSEDQIPDIEALSLKQGNETEATKSPKDTRNVCSPSDIDIQNRRQNKSGQCGQNKSGGRKRNLSDVDSLVVLKEKELVSVVEKKAPHSSIMQVKYEVESDLKPKPMRRPGRCTSVTKTDINTASSSRDSDIEAGPCSDIEGRPSFQGNCGVKELPPADYKDGDKKRQRGKKSATVESSNKKGIVSSKSKASSKGQCDLGEARMIKGQKKRKLAKKEASETPNGVKAIGENLVNCQIKVWWPEDQKYYAGVVSDFDARSKKHKVLYADGDDELLNLKEEIWELVGNKFLSDEEQKGSFPSLEPSSGIGRKEKKTVSVMKARSASSSRRSSRTSGNNPKLDATVSPTDVDEQLKCNLTEASRTREADKQTHISLLETTLKTMSKSGKWRLKTRSQS